MRDPYEVLEIGKNATAEEIKAAYKKLAKKYHPDKYANNPLADLAEEKMKEINEAYSYLLKNKRGYSEAQHQRQNSQQGSSSYGQQKSYSGAQYVHVRSYIGVRRYNEAYALLNAMRDRDAEWYYLSGVVMMNLGWHNKAYQNLMQAVGMDPGNMEYRNALNNMNNRNMNYRQYGGGYSSPGGCSNCCDVCSCLVCSDCMCECCGGDLIDCI